MAWCQRGNKPLFEPMMAQFTDMYLSLSSYEANNMHSTGPFYIDDWVQDCSNSIANTLELLQSYTKPSIWFFLYLWYILCYSYICML